MKSNLKEQVAELQSTVEDLGKRLGRLYLKVETGLVPHLQNMSRELVDLKDKIKPEIVVEELEESEASLRDALGARINEREVLDCEIENLRSQLEDDPK